MKAARSDPNRIRTGSETEEYEMNYDEGFAFFHFSIAAVMSMAGYRLDKAMEHIALSSAVYDAIRCEKSDRRR